MSKTGPILIIEDDEDDKRFLEDILKQLGYSNKLVWYDNTEEAHSYLCTTEHSVFVIFSDVNLPGKNGLEFKKKIDSDPHLRQKSIPFVFYSTSARPADVNMAYTEMTVQGFFKKARTFNEAKQMFAIILEYWTECRHPNLQ